MGWSASLDVKVSPHPALRKGISTHCFVPWFCLLIWNNCLWRLRQMNGRNLSCCTRYHCRELFFSGFWICLIFCEYNLNEELKNIPFWIVELKFKTDLIRFSQIKLFTQLFSSYIIFENSFQSETITQLFNSHRELSTFLEVLCSLVFLLQLDVSSIDRSINQFQLGYYVVKIIY